MAYVLAVLAALANALTSILQRMGVENAPAEKTLTLGLLAYAVRRKVWIAGFVLMIGAFLLQFLALHFGRLTTVQPILTLELPFLVVVLGVWFRQPLTWKEWVGSSAAAGGLAAFLVLAAPGGGNETPDLDNWGIVSFAVIAGGSFAVLLARFGSPVWRAAWFGVAGALAFAFTASIIKEVNEELMARGWAHLFVTWPPYAMAAMGLVGMFLAQNAFQAGPVTASQSALVIVDPLASIAIGIGLFGDSVRAGGGFLVGEILAMVVLSLGVLSLARSPLVVRVKSEDEAGPDPHLLGPRARGRITFARGRSHDGSGRTDGDVEARSGSAWEPG